MTPVFPLFPSHVDITNTNEIIANLVKELPPRDSLKRSKIVPILTPSVVTRPAEFEKDDDSNHHIDFIAACANLRAEKWGCLGCLK